MLSRRLSIRRIFLRQRFSTTIQIFGFISIFLFLITFIVYLRIEKLGFVQNGPQNVTSLSWWKTAIIYEIYLRSFQDSDSDGVGDLKGIISRVDYLKDLGIGAVWLTPFYPSPMVDFGYDITNFTDVDPIFGTLDDFDDLLLELKARGIKMIVDFVPNHTSNLHTWFQKSIKQIDPYTHYYVWKNPKGYNESGHPIPPNNWLSIHGSVWEWNEERKQFYLHHYEKEQPDLNVRYLPVMDELDRALKFWLNRGVDGIRLDAISRLFEVADVYQDAPINEEAIGRVNPSSRGYLKQIYTTNQPETFKAIRRWRKILDSYDDRLLIAEVSSSLDDMMAYYGTRHHPLADFPFNFYIINRIRNLSQVTGNNLRELINKWLLSMPKGKWPNWVLGSHDVHRVTSRTSPELIDALHMMNFLLPGTPITYYGEEIGMEDGFITFEEALDARGVVAGPADYLKVGRDPERTPMHWDDSANAGFSVAKKTWLPLGQNYKNVNVGAQLDAAQSHLHVYKNLARLRRDKVFTHGHFEFCVATKQILAFVRYLGGSSFVIIMNVSAGAILFDLPEHSFFPLPSAGKVVVRSSFDDRLETRPGSHISLDSVPLLPREGLVIQF